MFSLKVHNFVNGEDVGCPHRATLREVFESMKKQGKGYAILFKDSVPVGIITERDLIRLITEGISLDEEAYNYASKGLI
ncbi:MAG: CBS domain-containing protein, partial [Aquificaceae bacterium]|nr:CBS domain-containing protein [Aquificaceae bacterium]